MNQNHIQNTDEVIVAVLIAAFVLILLVTFIVAFILYYQKRRNAHVSEMNSIKVKFQQTLLESQLEIKEQTLQHIAGELHDNIGQIASLIKINLHTLPLNDPKAIVKIEDTKELVRQLIGDLKLLTKNLSGDRVSQLGIAKCIEIDVGRLNKTSLFEASLLQEGTMPVVDGNTAVILYRMVQEIINNAVKHSDAKHIDIVLRSSENLLALVCTDDGKGFDQEEKIRSGGAGLINLQNRAKLINARLFIESSPEAGTTVSIELPL
jgi:two-component system NarL family sensor kinase